MRTRLTLATSSREPSPNTREFCTVKGMTLKNVLMRLWTHPCLKTFFTRMKMLSRPDGFMLNGKLGVDFFKQKCKILGKLKDKEVANLYDHGCPKVEILLILNLMKKSGNAPVTHSDTTPHFTVQSAEQKCLVTSQCII